MTIHPNMKVRLPGGETGRTYRPVVSGPPPEPICWIIELDQRRSNGEGCDVVEEKDLEPVNEGTARI